MSDTDPNSGPGWNDHDTPYGTIHSYDAPGSLGTGGNAGSHTNIGPTTRLSIPSSKWGVFINLLNFPHRVAFGKNLVSRGLPPCTLDYKLAQCDKIDNLPVFILKSSVIAYQVAISRFRRNHASIIIRFQIRFFLSYGFILVK